MTAPFSPLTEDPVLVTLYQDQLNPYPYPFRSFLEALKMRLGLLSAGIDIGIGDDDIEPVPITYYPVDTAKETELFKFYQQHWRAYPRKPRLRAGDRYTLSQIVSAKEFANNPYIQTFLAPFGVCNELVTAVCGPDGVLCLLKLGVGKGVQFTDSHVAFIKQLYPHLEKALQMHMRVRRPVSIINTLTSMADTLGIGFLILNGHKKVIQQNEVAQRIAQQGGYLSVVNARIHFTKTKHYNKMAAEFFERALLWRYQDYQRSIFLEPCNHDTSDDMPSAIFRIDRDDGTYVDVLVQPVRTFFPYRNETSPHLIVYIVDSARGVVASEQLLIRLYALTRTEARLAILLANGHSIADSAASLGLTEGSARTYSKKIYAKTGVRRQAELVQVLHKSVLSLASSGIGRNDRGDRGR